MKYFILSLVGFCFSASAELSTIDQEALKNTQEVLSNPEKRQQALEKDPKAQSVDKSLDALASDPKNKQKIYDISSSVFSELAQKAAGDPKVMEKLIEEAQKNPEAFYKTMFPEAQKKEVRDLANEIEKTKAPTAPGQR